MSDELNIADLKIEYLPITALKPYKRNARKHQETDIAAIMSSIKQFGFNDPIGIWGNDNIIVEGHGRLMAAKKLKMETVPVIRLDHLTDEQRRAYALAHNKTAENSEWDLPALDGELGDIFDIDMSDFGFDIDTDENDKVKIETKPLSPYNKVHYLITADINDNDTLLKYIEEIRGIEGVEVESTIN